MQNLACDAVKWDISDEIKTPMGIHTVTGCKMSANKDRRETDRVTFGCDHGASFSLPTSQHG